MVFVMALNIDLPSKKKGYVKLFRKCCYVFLLLVMF